MSAERFPYRETLSPREIRERIDRKQIMLDFDFSGESFAKVMGWAQVQDAILTVWAYGPDEVHECPDEGATRLGGGEEPWTCSSYGGACVCFDPLAEIHLYEACGLYGSTKNENVFTITVAYPGVTEVIEDPEYGPQGGWLIYLSIVRSLAEIMSNG